MAHFARIENDKVVEVIAVNNEVLLDSKGIESETIGTQFCAETFGGEWVQTSYSGKFRGRFAGQGMFYDKANDIFLDTQPTE